MGKPLSARKPFPIRDEYARALPVLAGACAQPLFVRALGTRICPSTAQSENFLLESENTSQTLLIQTLGRLAKQGLKSPLGTTQRCSMRSPRMVRLPTC